ncbi:hypothetical protein HMPREF1868_01939 [Olsenella sp. DNF00959]|nr:hypothetical protein HMPREF1868_01939 [Olsenella sp. DNF00959]
MGWRCTAGSAMWVGDASPQARCGSFLTCTTTVNHPLRHSRAKRSKWVDKLPWQARNE